VGLDEICNFAGQTSVVWSFEQPDECMEFIAGGTLNLLEVMRYLRSPVRFFNAGSSESLGNTGVQAGEAREFTLGNMDICRDWGWAQTTSKQCTRCYNYHSQKIMSWAPEITFITRFCERGIHSGFNQSR